MKMMKHLLNVQLIMRKAIFVSFLVLLYSCGQKEGTSSTVDQNDAAQSTAVSVAKDEKIKNGLLFVNGYVDNLNKMAQAKTALEWSQSSALCTQKFRDELKRILDEAIQQDPEMGLGADPILDAQDNPEKGFELESFDDAHDLLIVRGIDMPDFKLAIVLKEENGLSLVDGCGMVNVPADKRIKR